MLQRIMNESMVGQYSLAYAFGGIIFTIFEALNHSWIPFYFEDMKQGKQGPMRAQAKNFLETYTVLAVGFMLLAPEEQLAGLSGMPLLQAAMGYHFGQAGVVFTAVALWLFCFSTFIGILYYARGNVAYLFGDNWMSQNLYKALALLMLFIGGIAAYTFVWELGDIGVALMTIFNLIVIVPMGGKATSALREYNTLRKNGEKP